MIAGQIKNEGGIIIIILFIFASAFLTPNLSGAQNLSKPLAVDSINLLDDRFTWKPHVHAKVFQNADRALDIIIETNSKEKLYNRAYLETELKNLSKRPIALLLNYSYTSQGNNIIFATEIREMHDNAQTGTPIVYYSLDKKAAQVLVPLDNDIRKKPIEFRLYGITNGPAFAILGVKEVRLLLNESNDYTRP